MAPSGNGSISAVVNSTKKQMAPGNRGFSLSRERRNSSSIKFAGGNNSHSLHQIIDVGSSSDENNEEQKIEYFDDSPEAYEVSEGSMGVDLRNLNARDNEIKYIGVIMRRKK